MFQHRAVCEGYDNDFKMFIASFEPFLPRKVANDVSLSEKWDFQKNGLNI